MDKYILDYHRDNASVYRSSHGSSQKAISAKIDCSLIEDIEVERRTTGVTTNRLINMAVKWYLQELDEARREAAHGIKGENLTPMNEDQLVKYILELIGEYDRKKLLNIAKVKRTTLESTIIDALEAYIEDFYRRPFSHL